MGAGIDITSPHGAFVVNIGGGMADMAVISLGGTALTGTVRSAGNAMDEEIIRYIRHTYNMHIGKHTAENAKINAGSVIPGTVSGTYTIKGKCMITGMPIKVDIDADYYGFTVGNQFIVGYGLDYNQSYRQLPYITVLTSE